MSAPDDDLDRAHTLMMAALDDECTEAERRELERLVESRPALAVEWNRLRRVKEVTMTMGLRQPPEEVWDRYRLSTLHRIERGIAWTLVALGGAVLAGWGLWLWLAQLLRDTGVPFAVRAAVVAVVVGLFLLLVSVVRERWFLHRRDPYSREVIR